MSRSFSATVRKGVIVADDDVDLPEGAVVTVIVDDEPEYVPIPEELAELEAAIAEADAHPDAGIPLEQLLEELRQMRPPLRSS